MSNPTGGDPALPEVEIGIGHPAIRVGKMDVVVWETKFPDGSSTFTLFRVTGTYILDPLNVDILDHLPNKTELRVLLKDYGQPAIAASEEDQGADEPVDDPDLESEDEGGEEVEWEDAPEEESTDEVTEEQADFVPAVAFYDGAESEAPEASMVI